MFSLPLKRIDLAREYAIDAHSNKKKPFGHDLSLLLPKSSKDLERRDVDVIGGMISVMVRSSLPKTQKSEAFAWHTGNLELTVT